MKKLEHLKDGIIGGIPIALGYFAVSFSLGIQAKQAGMSAFHATLMSLTCVTSAGEFAGINIIRDSGTYVEMAISQLIINLRYLLMSCALTQKIDPKYSPVHRLLMAFGITDEIFGIGIARGNNLSPLYIYGAMLVAIPGWCAGTCLGVIMGNILPLIVVNALSVALYGMFIAIFIPPAKENKNVAIAVIIAMLSSFLFTKLPVVSNISSGMKVIILTIVISLIFAILAPVDDADDIADVSEGDGKSFNTKGEA